jgi:DNA-binding winged helix-turn-helix (wHTH) protein/TolB-like protein
MLASRVLRFDAFTLDLSRAILLKGDEQLALRRQSFEVLRHLAEQTGEVVSTEELIEAVWTTRPAQPEHSVVQCIRDIRRALGEDARWIVRTVSGRGYQFMAEVTPVDVTRPVLSAESSGVLQIDAVPVPEHSSEAGAGFAPAPPHHWRRALIAVSLLICVLAAGGWSLWRWTAPEPPPAPTMMAMPTLAVLPFEAAGDDQEVREAALGLFNNLASEVTRVPLSYMHHFRSASGRPAPSHGSTELAAAGRQLDARYLVLGSVSRDGGVLRVNTRLIEAQRGLQIWTTAFEYRPEPARPALSLLAARLVWMMIVAESRLALPPRPEAGHYAMLGRAVRGQDVDPKANREAIAHYERSLALNPNWMPTLIIYPWAHLALIDSGLVPPGEVAARLHRVEEVIDRGIRLQPTHLTLLSHRGKLLRLLGDADGAIAQLTNVQAMGQNIVALAELGRAKIDAGRTHEALAHIETAIRTIPDFGAVHLWRFWAGQGALLLGDHGQRFNGSKRRGRRASPTLIRCRGWRPPTPGSGGRPRPAPSWQSMQPRHRGSRSRDGLRSICRAMPMPRPSSPTSPKP